MIIQNQIVIQKWNNKSKKYYEQKGYKFTKRGDSFEIKVEDLLKTSKVNVKVKCDYCGKEIEKPYRIAINDFKHSCKRCSSKKVKDSNIMKYGVLNTSQLESVKEKTRQTCFKKYGVSHPLKNESVKNKLKNTNIEKYGNNCAMNSIEIKEKIKENNIKKYGVEYYTQTDEFKEKYKETSLKKYGVDHPFKSEIVKEKIKNTFLNKYGINHNMKSKLGYETYKKSIIEKYNVDNISKNDLIKSKIKESLYKNGSAPCSKQQKYLYELLGGELNYPIDWYSLDIAFPNEMIYIEYDGSGHDLRVKKGYITQSEFNKLEVSRKKYLQNKGWKLIRIISSKDKLLQDNKIEKLINEAKLYLKNSNHTWVEINIDTLEFKCNEYSYFFS